MSDSRHALRKHIASLSDEQLIVQLRHLVEDDRRLTAKLLAHMAEVDRRKLYLEQACSSMHRYCVERLHMSEPQTYLRIRAARAARRFPRILGMVANNELHLSAIALLSPHLTHENHTELLDAAKHMSKRQVELLVAERFPQPDAREEIRKLPQPAPRSTLPEPTGTVTSAVSQRAASIVLPPPRPPIIRPTAPERFKIQFAASRALHDKLRAAQALLRHKVPNGDVADIMELALDALLEKTKRRRIGATDRPRDSSTKESERHTRHIPNEIRRAVAKRDDGRCTYVDAAGKRCNETSMIEFHHIRPYANGGEHSVDNITLRCAPHNRRQAEMELGREVIAQKMNEARLARAAREQSPTASGRSTQKPASTEGVQLGLLTPSHTREPCATYFAKPLHLQGHHRRPWRTCCAAVPPAVQRRARMARGPPQLRPDAVAHSTNSVQLQMSSSVSGCPSGPLLDRSNHPGLCTPGCT